MKSLWFIAIVPDKETAEKVDVHRHYMAEHFDAKHTLKSPPHITLFPPFHLSESEMESTAEQLEDFFSSYGPFKLKLNGFDKFAPRAIYINVEENKDLTKMHAELQDWMQKQIKSKKKKERRFTAHFTLAHRDLDPDDFDEAWEHFRDKDFEAQFTAEQVELLRHNGQRWEFYKSFSLGGE